MSPPTLQHQHSSSSLVQYGFRDEDDESDDGRSSLFGGIRQSSSRRLKKFGNVISDTKSLLKGANSTMAGHLSGLYGLDNSDDEDDDNSYDNEESSESSDDASVCSKASVASKAGQKLKKLGGKVSHGLNSSLRSLSFHGGSDHHKDHNKDAPPPHVIAPDHDDDDCSVNSRSSRASAAVKRVKGGLSKALKVVKKKKRHSGKAEPHDHHLDDDLSLSSDEEDLFISSTAAPTARARRGRGLAGLTRSLTSGGSNHGPRDMAPKCTKAKPRRHTSAPLGGRIKLAELMKLKRNKDNGDDSDSDSDDDSSLSDLSGNEQDNAAASPNNSNTKYFNPPPVDCPPKKESSTRNKSTTTPSAYQNNWSMNVTPDMLEEAMNAEEQNNGKRWDTLTLPRHLLPLESSSGKGTGTNDIHTRAA